MPAHRRKGAPYQLVLGHSDTVWPIGTIERMPVRLERGMLFGPGVFDMKAGLAQMVFALEALNAEQHEPEVTPVLLINSDEEIGSPETTRSIVRLARGADRVLVLEPALGLEGRLKTSRKGLGRFTVRVVGRAAHAGLDPESGASAILELSHVIQQLFALNDAQKGTSINVGTIDGGLRPNVIAPESCAVVDVRIRDDDEARRVERAIRGLRTSTPGTSLEVHGGMGRPPMAASDDSRRLWQLACEASEEMGLSLDQGTAGGGSDGNTASRFAPTIDGLGPVGDGAHAAHEFVFIDRLAERAALLARLLAFPPLDGAPRD
jgi:glutamate carboxypeptidase